MSRPLTLPGTIPGLLRRCSPTRCSKPWGSLGLHDVGIVLNVSVTEKRVLLATHRSDYPLPPIDCIALDLGSATGRAHAAWWLAEQLQGEVTDAFASRVPPRWVYSEAGWRAWQVTGSGVGRCWTVGRAPLADLDPDDPRALPDGSRVVDALALQAVCLHVAGLQP